MTTLSGKPGWEGNESLRDEFRQPVKAKRNIPTMETYTGRQVDLTDPKPEQIALADIAVGLANTCRYGGQLSRWYSVAEHSVRVANELAGTRYELHGLLHDAHEAYTGDLIAPLKYTLELSAPGVVRDMQKRLDKAIALSLGVATLGFTIDLVKEADDAVMFQEAAGLKYSHGIGDHWGNYEYHEPLTDFGWPPAEAERRFLETYRRLTNG